MKKLLSLGLIALSLASCTKDEEMSAEKKSTANNALSFSSYIAGGTRASIANSASLLANGFKVSALYGGDFYFTNKSTVADASNIFDTQDGTYYWPLEISAANKMTFYANNFGLDMGTAVADAGKLSYTVKPSASVQEDLVVASAQTGIKPTDGIQPLNFAHALSKINFSFVGANPDFTYTVSKIEVIANGGDATCKIGEFTSADDAAGGAQTPATPLSWTCATVVPDVAPASGGVTYTYLSADETVTGATATALNENMMLLPQAEKVVVKVYYKVESGTTLLGDCGYTAVGSVYGYKSVVLSGTDVNWEAGKSYRYTLTLPVSNFKGDTNGDGDPDEFVSGVDTDGDDDDAASEFDSPMPIRFSVAVFDWETETGNAITIR